MTPTQSRLIVERLADDITSVQFVDRNILEEPTIQKIGEELSSMIDEATTPKMLLTFTSVEHLASAALGMLITVNNQVHQKGGQLRLSDIDPQIYEVFVITKLNKLFQIFDDADSALKSFQ